MMSVRAASSGISQTPCATTISASTLHQAQRLRLRPDTRTTTRSSTSASSSALLSAAKTTRPTSSATGRVIDSAENRTGVAIIEMPTVIPSHVKATHAGFRKAFRIRCITGI